MRQSRLVAPKAGQRHEVPELFLRSPDEQRDRLKPCMKPTVRTPGTLRILM